MQRIHFNKIIVYLTTSDVFTWGLLVVLNSIIGIYLATKLGENVVQFVGIGTGIFSLVKGSLQLPIGILGDRHHGEKDEILMMFAGNILMGLPFLLYPSINSPYFYYLLQVVLGTGVAFNLVNWRKLFARHLDKDKEGLTYGAYDAVMSFSIAIFSIVAGFTANLSQEYFDYVVVAIGLVIMSSGIWALLMLRVIDATEKK